MSSSLRVNAIVPASGTNVAIGTAGGTITYGASVTGISTFSTLNATRIVGVTTAGITTAYVGSINDGPISGARNRIINGDMRIDQRNAGGSVNSDPATNPYIIDRFRIVQSGGSSGAFKGERSATAPTGFVNSFLLTSLAATSFSGTIYHAIRQPIEGFNCADLMWGTASASAITLSFWTRSSLTGTFGGAIGNQAGNRSYPFTFAISATNTWEYKTVTIPGDTTGTWPTDNSGSINVWFSLGAGSDRKGTAGVWNANFNTSATGAVDVNATNGATFHITGVQLEAGTVATPFERRSYGQELALCQRYAVRFGGEGTYSVIGFGRVSSTTSCFTLINLPVEMRVKPTLTSSGSYEVNGISVTGFSVDTNASTRKGSIVNASVASGLTAGQAGALLAMADTNASFLLNAEL
jgi:hypothetical protein